MAGKLELSASTTHAVAKITCPNAEVAERLASALVEEKAAACVNIVPGVISVYNWQGQLCKDSELLLLVKTTFDKAEEVLRIVAEHHPYEVPEVIWTGVAMGSKSYLDWLSQSV